MYLKLRLINLVIPGTGIMFFLNIFQSAFLPRQDPLGCKQSRVEAQPRTLFCVFCSDFFAVYLLPSFQIFIVISSIFDLVLAALCLWSFKTRNSWLIFGRETEMQRLMAVLLCWDVLWTDRAEPRLSTMGTEDVKWILMFRRIHNFKMYEIRSPWQKLCQNTWTIRKLLVLPFIRYQTENFY